jgi:hypothetical protein
MLIDPRLNDLRLSEQERWHLARVAGLLAADHPQLWKDSDLQRSANRALELRRQRDAEKHETVRLFTPAPAVMPGQAGLFA